MRKILIILIEQILFLLFFFLVMRFIFLGVYFERFSALPLNSLIIAILRGIRFDLSVIAYLYGLLNLPLFFLKNRSLQKNWMRISMILGALILVVLTALQLSDLVYYGLAGRRISIEIFHLGNDLPAMLQLVFEQYLLFFVFSVFITAACQIFWIVCWNRWFRLQAQATSLSWKKALSAPLFILILIVLGARGGFQMKPLTENHAFLTPHTSLGHLSLNTPFTALRVLATNEIHPKNYLPEEIAIKKTQSLLQIGEQQTFLDPRFPFYRRRETETKVSDFPVPPKNVVLIILESWGSHFLEQKPELTPFFNQLKQKGVYFNNFYSAGTRSIEGLAAILGGIPAFQDFAFLMSPFEQNNISNLNSIFPTDRYHTFFLHGSGYGSFGLHQYASRLGYEKIIALEDYENYEDHSDAVWGIWDHVQYERFISEAEKLTKSFFATIFTVSFHEPYEIPKNFTFSEHQEPKSKLEKTLLYSDYALRAFIEKSSQTDWFKNTLFVITADHSYKGNNTLSSVQIPLLFYTPSGFLEPKLMEYPASQIDIMPGIIEFLDLSTDHALMGKSVFTHHTKHFATFSLAQEYWMTNDFLYRFYSDQLTGIFKYREDPELRHPLSQRDSDLHQENIQDYKAWSQTTHNAIVNNRLIP